MILLVGMIEIVERSIKGKNIVDSVGDLDVELGHCHCPVFVNVTR